MQQNRFFGLSLVSVSAICAFSIIAIVIVVVRRRSFVVRLPTVLWLRKLDARVDGVAGGAGHIADDHARFANQAVE